MKDPNSKWFWTSVLGLLLIVVPYGFVGRPQTFVWGFPVWVIFSLGGAVAIALLSVFVIQKHWNLSGHKADVEK